MRSKAGESFFTVLTMFMYRIFVTFEGIVFEGLLRTLREIPEGYLASMIPGVRITSPETKLILWFCEVPRKYLGKD